MRIFEKVTIGILAIIILIQIYQINRLNEISNNVSNKIGSLEHNIHSIQGSVSSSVHSIMNRIKEENATIKRVDWQAVGIENKEVILHCEVQLNQVEKTAVPYLLYRVKDTVEWEKEEFKANEGLNYITDIRLDPKKAYEYQIYVEGETKKSGEIQQIPSYLYRYAEFDIDILGHYDHREDNARRTFVIQLVTRSKQEFKPLRIEKASINLYHDEKLLDSVNMIKASEFRKTIEKGMDEKAQRAIKITEGVAEEIAVELMAQINVQDYKEPVNRIIAKITYYDGSIVERVVYPQNR